VGLVSLSASQRRLLKAALHWEAEKASWLSAVERKVGEDRFCPHCVELGAISHGTEGGLRCYQCKACRKTFRSATGTALRGLHKKDEWLTFGECLRDGKTLEAAAQRCGIAVSTAFRWRHRFLGTRDEKANKLTEIVEVDETYYLESRKGQRDLERPARRRGSTASKRGLSAEQVPSLVAADRSCTTTGAALSSVTAEKCAGSFGARHRGRHRLGDGRNSVYPRCARSLGVRHERLNLSDGKRVRDPFHIQTVNNRHSRFADFLDRYCGISTKHLDNYLRWFERTKLEEATSVSCPESAMTQYPLN